MSLSLLSLFSLYSLSTLSVLSLSLLSVLSLSLLSLLSLSSQSLQGMSLQFHFQFKNALISKGIISNRQAERTESSFHTQDFPPDLD